MAKKKKTEFFDDSFYVLANEVTKTLAENKDGTDQKQQVEELLDAERKFKEVVLKYRQSTEVYKQFLQKVCIQNKNILSARPYFRESAVNFSSKITPAIKMGNIDVLKTFDINYQLISFIRSHWKGPFPEKAEALFKRVHKAREILIENNLPLAINRAKLFYRKTPKSHLSLMDLIGISSLGLTSAVDKYCGPYTTVFRGVIIGRCVGNMIEAYSETVMHLYPSDKRILYKANSIRGRQGIEDVAELAIAVKDAFIKDSQEGKSMPKSQINTGELVNLLGAATLLSVDSTMDDEGHGVYSYYQDPNSDTEKSFIQRETNTMLLKAAQMLPLLMRKILRLKGVKL